MASKSWNAIDQTKLVFPLYYCAFLDMLGYKDKSALYFKNEFNIPGRIERAMESISLSIRLSELLVDTTEISIETFSDSIVIFQPAKPDGAANILLFSSIFVSNLGFEGLFVRGGIAMGKHHDYRTKTGFRVLTSEALQKAYYLESICAQMPRVIIDSEMIPFLSAQEKSMIIMDGTMPMLHYANHVINREGQNLNNVYAEMSDIKQAMDTTKDMGVRDKCQWLLDYYYWTISKIMNADVSRFLLFTSVAKTRFRNMGKYGRTNIS